MTDELRVVVARAIARGLGDEFDHAFASKTEWNQARGEKGGRMRDINEPMQGDYLEASDAALAAIKAAGYAVVPAPPPSRESVTVSLKSSDETASGWITEIVTADELSVVNGVLMKPRETARLDLQEDGTWKKVASDENGDEVRG